MKVTIRQFLNKITSVKSFAALSLFITLVYFFLKTHLFISTSGPIGDETCFLESFDAISRNGLYHELCRGKISPLFSVLGVFFNFFIDNPLYAFRTISLLSTLATILLVLYFARKKLNLSGIYFFSALIFMLSFLGFRIYWQGINDSLFHLLIACSFFVLYNIHFKKRTTLNLIYLGIIIGLLFGTRLLAFLVVPCYIFFIWKPFKNILITAIPGLLLGLLFHLPSLLCGNGISEQDKEPKNGLKWSQKNYLSQVLIYENKLEDGKRVTWEELQAYIDENGDENLPKTFFKTITFNPKITAYSFVKNFYNSITAIYFCFFGIGIVFLIYFFYIGLKNYSRLSEKFKFSSKLINAFWLHTLFISFVSFTMIEARWYTSFIYLGILVFHQLSQYYGTYEETKRQLFLKINFAILTLFQLQFILLDHNFLSAILRENLKNILH
nr:hypothetical protein [uncultured Flavobacterium sp.]